MRAHHGVISLAPLDRAQVRRMVGEIASRHALSDEMIDGVGERTGGVPLFVEEVTRLLLERNAQGGAQAIPPTLQQSLAARLDRLGEAREVAQIGAVLGREFSYRLLRDVAAPVAAVADRGSPGQAGLTEAGFRGLDELRLQAALDRLTEADLLLVEGAPPTAAYRFKHALIQDAAYESLLKSRRQALHRRAAEALRDANAEPEAIADALPAHHSRIIERSPEAVAIHLFEAQRFEEAADLFARAARAASARSAHSEAINHVTMALRATRTFSDAEARRESELRLRLLLGPSLIAARGYGSEEVGDNYRRARSLCESAVDSAELFGAVHGLTAYFLVTEHIEEASELAQTALGVAHRRSDDDELLEASTWLGTIRFFQGMGVEAASMLDGAIHKYDALAHARHRVIHGLDPGVLAMSHRCWLHWLNGEVVAAAAMADQMLTLAETLDHPISRAHALNYVAGLAVFLGDHVRAQAKAREEIKLARTAKLPHYQAYGMILLGRALMRDDAQAAVESVIAGLELRKSTGALLALPLHQGLLAEVQLARGAIDDATLAVSAGLEVAERTGERWWSPELYRLSAVIDHQAGRSDVERTLRHAHRVARDSGAAMPSMKRWRRPIASATAGSKRSLTGPAGKSCSSATRQSHARRRSFSRRLSPSRTGKARAVSNCARRSRSQNSTNHSSA